MNRRTSKFLLSGLAAAGMLFGASALVSATGSVAEQGPVGQLSDAKLWQIYVQRFVRPSGRVVDNANGNVSHSESQGYGMLLALAANDPKSFRRIYRFVDEHLKIRKDNLIAWRWQPNKAKPVADLNNATDGDLLIAWALMEAAQAGYGQHYLREATAILRDVKPLIKRWQKDGLIIQPAQYGFGPKDNKGRQIINLSYWVFPALERLSQLTGDPLWQQASDDGKRWVRKAIRNRAGLPSDWSELSRRESGVRPSQKFGPAFSYNAVRVPLHLAWSQKPNDYLLKSMQSNWSAKSNKVYQWNVTTGGRKSEFAGQGYRAVSALLNCANSGARFPRELRTNLDKLYYSASLQLFSIIVIKQKYPSCW